MKRTYRELKSIPTFIDRFEYLKLGGIVGEETFGYDRYLYQDFLHSDEWKNFRHKIIVRDNGCDLGISDREIQEIIIIHHLNPVTIDDIKNHNYKVILNPNNVICVSSMTHEAIHYGDESLLVKDPIIRKPGDTKLW